MTFNLEKVRMDFPILKKKINNYPLSYLDSATTSQRPISVINKEVLFYKQHYAGIHRGIHTLSMNATSMIEDIRKKVANFINSFSSEEIIFTKGTTEGINLIANSLCKNYLCKGDNIIITEMEHHSNIVPWQIIAENIGIDIRILPMTQNGILNIKKLPVLIDKRTKVITFTHISNVLGIINPIKEIIRFAKEKEIITVIDGAQAIMHKKIDVRSIGCDFYVFSSHKMYGPNGIGILYGKKNILKKMSPYESGGSMIEKVTLPYGTTYRDVPWLFEAGTLNVGGIIGLGAAIDYIENLGINNIYEYEKNLMQYAILKLEKIEKLKIYGSKTNKIGVLSFNLDQHHAYDVGSFLDQYGIAIRTGHHCAMPLMNYFNVSNMCRASFVFYNTKEEVDHLFDSLKKIQRYLK
ncbi:SufS family cysteine desulfurase [Candidatus Tachikawaea gelatinosa]|uniref:Cysteine desulfurase n=1 Tax=Candidatus Tachikawaea gelatinosa TaxID=1410383 RepID=A0A090AS38_9ENTR|nr:SufS family cysteine desulfurase [Candidatus Tachikawaea gelatinosa]BAP58670.1 cysteine desulfurase [Candidatus Tachikawaea gelatinosa]